MIANAPPIAHQALLANLRAHLSASSLIRENEPLAKRTTLRVGGPADIYVEPASEEDLGTVLHLSQRQETRWMLLGRGSNLLVRDGGIRGVVICLVHPDFSRILVQGERIRAGAGARLRALALEAKKAALTSFEFMEGIPGNVGGALRMNAGAMGSSMFQVVESIRFMAPDGSIGEKEASDIPVEYRSCPLFKTHIVLSALFRGVKAERSEIDRRMNECSQKRWNSQPAAPSAGCIFKNCLTVPTGKLIEELGLKGTRRGGAVISDVHGNFIVNEGGATARDILELIALIQEKARKVRHIELQTEVQVVGED